MVESKDCKCTQAFQGIAFQGIVGDGVRIDSETFKRDYIKNVESEWLDRGIIA